MLCEINYEKTNADGDYSNDMNQLKICNEHLGIILYTKKVTSEMNPM
ncbi:hypothetical protein SAMN04487895_10115 [Paenibacillus sophorae]|uniref:Uncharacterized protein n=1 Tax=Paenibacillus sophorae TaxID=1333845 RepID=A0A1H8F8N4_9BACL|nr:hypothetical protein SAMN04487895_10115 [Paenibacillus sophorae]